MLPNSFCVPEFDLEKEIKKLGDKVAGSLFSQIASYIAKTARHCSYSNRIKLCVCLRTIFSCGLIYTCITETLLLGSSKKKKATMVI